MQNGENMYPKLIRLMTKEDWVHTGEFIKEYFHPRYILLNRKFFDWQYQHNPYGKAGKFSFKIADTGGRFLGFLGFVPYQLMVAGSTHVSAGALCNFMIRKDCRALGFGSLFIRDMENDFQIIWGTGYNEKTAPMYEKMGWRLMGNVHRYIKVLDSKRMAQFTYGTEFNGVSPFEDSFCSLPSRRHAVTKTERFGEEIEALGQRLSGKYPIAVERRTDYLNWRYADHPKFRYSILVSRKGKAVRGYIVFRLERAIEEKGSGQYLVGRIVDLMASDDAELDLLSGAVDYIRQKGAIMADYFCTGRFHGTTLEKLGFVRGECDVYSDIPRRLNPIDREKIAPINFVVHVNPKVLQRDLFFDINNWYITTGEGDTDRPN